MTVPLLTPDAAGRCTLRVVYDVEGLAPAGAVPEVPSAMAGHHAAEARQYRERVLERLCAMTPGAARARSASETVAAMRSGRPLIVGAVLPDDPTGGRRGGPDALIRADDAQETDDGPARYWPVIVVNHRALDTKRSQVLEHLADPEVAVVHLEKLGQRLRPAGQLPPEPPVRRDGLALAHHHRLLEACGHASTDAVAVVIGADEAVAWTDLARHDLLDAYDDAFAERRGAVEAALADAVRPAPVKVGECERCRWRAHCREQLDAADSVSLVPGVGPTPRALLEDLGVRTRRDLAAMRVAGGLDPRLDGLGDLATSWWEEAVDQAWAATAGGGRPHRRRQAPPLLLPDHALEVDLDMENALDGSVYLWGLLVDDRYQPVVDWGPPGPELAARVFVAFWDRVEALLDRSRREHRRLVFYVWHEQAELGAMRQGAAAAADQLGRTELVDDLEHVLAEHLDVVDLLQVYRERFVHGNGYSLKVVAPKVGFTWVDPDPSGSESMVWHQQAVTPPSVGEPDQRTTMRERLLRYNEDDVRATAAIRHWLRTATPSDLPG